MNTLERFRIYKINEVDSHMNDAFMDILVDNPIYGIILNSLDINYSMA
jgi:hypothetical protein